MEGLIKQRSILKCKLSRKGQIVLGAVERSDHVDTIQGITVEIQEIFN